MNNGHAKPTSMMIIASRSSWLLARRRDVWRAEAHVFELGDDSRLYALSPPVHAQKLETSKSNK